MILRSILVAAVVGYLQTLFIVGQTRLVAGGRTGLPIFAVSLCIGTVWVFGVHAAVTSVWSAAAYVVCAALGSTTAASLRLGQRRVRSERLPRSLRLPR
jgi:hypothetical protein